MVGSVVQRKKKGITWIARLKGVVPSAAMHNF